MDFAFTKEQSDLQQHVRRLAEEKIAPIAEEADESPTVHAGLMAILANDGLLRYCVPEEYGGVGVRVMDLCIIREELARVSAPMYKKPSTCRPSRGGRASPPLH